MKVFILILMVLCLIGTASADTIIDDFNRADNTTSIGINWNQSTNWQLNNSSVQVTAGGKRAILTNYTSSTGNISYSIYEEDNNFTDVTGIFGIDFYIQDPSNTSTGDRYYIYVRPEYDQVRLYKYVDSVITQIGVNIIDVPIWSNFDVLKIDTSTVDTGLKIYQNDNLLGTISAGDSNYTEGYSGIYVIVLGDPMWYDNYTIVYDGTLENPVISGISNQTANATVGYIDFTTDVNCNATINLSLNADMSGSRWLNDSADWPSNDSTSHTIKMIGLNGSTTYYYQIWAYNSSDTSKFTNSTTQSYTTSAGQTWIDVATDESIQHAVDNIYPSGTVNLTIGNFVLTDTIWITAHNVTVQGQGKDITLIEQTMSDIPAFICSKWIDYRTHGIWLANNNYKQDGLITRMAAYPNEIINNVTIQNMGVKGNHTGINLYLGIIAMHEGNDFNILDCNITGNGDSVAGTYKDRLSGTYMTFFVNGSVQNTIYKTVSEPLIYFYSDNADCINNTISYSNAANSIQYNSIRGNHGPCIIRDNNLNGSMGKLNVYSSNNIEIYTNYINITASINTGAIHFYIPVGPGYIHNNTITFDCGASCGDNGAAVHVSTLYNFKIYGNISNNIIYASTGHGISIVDQNSRPNWIYLNVSSNTINGSAKHGIYNPLDQPINITNNIIVNNDWSGIFNTTNNSYNNVWNNALGDYNITSNGTGNISADPLFASATDFHLNSTEGRWLPGTGWVTTDLVSSPAIDAGDPTSDYSLEPAPNGGRINMGAYGNTVYASLSETTLTIIIPANSLGMFNNWTTATTFSAIAANESNDVCYSFYNTTSGEWESFYIGFSWNANNVIGKDNSVIGFFNAETTITSQIITPSSTELHEGWNMLAVQNSGNQIITDIKSNIGANCTDVWWFNSTANAYSNTTSDTVQANQGILTYINTAFTWPRSDL